MERDADVPKMMFLDNIRLTQILVNIVGNSTKFTPPGGSIALRMSRVPESSQHVAVTIIDSGIGIPDEKQTQVFEPFSQADGSTTRRYGGTGLGLTISRRLVELLGGQFELRSVAGIGTTFRFTFRCIEHDGPRVEERSKSHGAADLRGARILLVDDNRVNQKVAQKMLERVGCLVSLAEDGEQALKALACSPFDLVLMDCQMPVVDGYEATRRIRILEDPKLRNIPVIALTAHAFREQIDACYACGMNDYLSKPVEMERLYAVLKKHLVGAASVRDVECAPQPVATL